MNNFMYLISIEYHSIIRTKGNGGEETLVNRTGKQMGQMANWCVCAT